MLFLRCVKINYVFINRAIAINNGILLQKHNNVNKSSIHALIVTCSQNRYIMIITRKISLYTTCEHILKNHFERETNLQDVTGKKISNLP